MAMGRSQKPYQTSWGEVIPGLARDTDGRWRIAVSGKRFTEPDERRAVARFRAQQAPDNVDTPSRLRVELAQDTGKSYTFLRSETPASGFWPWLREELIARPE